MTNRTWSGATDGTYTNTGNWIGGVVPAIGDTGIFGSGGATLAISVAGTAQTLDGWTFTGGAFYDMNVTTTVNLQVTGIQVTGGGEFIEVHAGGDLVFQGHSSAGGAFMGALFGGNITFQGNSDGGTARLIVGPSTSTVDFSASAGPLGDHKVNVGSIEGAGNILLAAGQKLFVGSNNLDSGFGGSIESTSATPGSMVKVGTGTLTLSGPLDFLQSLTIAGGTVALAGSAAQDIGEIDFAAVGGVARQASQALAEISLAHHPVTHIGVGPDDDDGTILGQLTAVLDIEGGVNHAPPIRFFGRGDGIDIATLPFVPGAKAKYTGGSAQKIVVKSGGHTVVFDHVLQPGLTHFAALSDDNGGTLLVPAIVESRPNQSVDAKHHPPHQHSPGSKPDVIVANGADDTIKGLRGNDILVARAQGVSLSGGPGADFFVFDAPKTSPASHHDVIMDFHHTQGDMIDLYGLFHATHGRPLVFMHGSFVDYNQAHPDVLGMVRYAGGELQVNFDNHLKTEFVVAVHGAVQPGDLIL